MDKEKAIERGVAVSHEQARVMFRMFLKDDLYREKK